MIFLVKKLFLVLVGSALQDSPVKISHAMRFLGDVSLDFEGITTREESSLIVSILGGKMTIRTFSEASPRFSLAEDGVGVGMSYS